MESIGGPLQIAPVISEDTLVKGMGSFSLGVFFKPKDFHACELPLQLCTVLVSMASSRSDLLAYRQQLLVVG